MSSFEEFIEELRCEAEAEGPGALAEFEVLDAYFAAEGEERGE
jgi:hypothetical protein